MRFNILLLLSIWVPSWSLTEARSSAWVSGPPNGYVPAFVTANRALSIRGGGEDDREWKFYEVVPIVSAVPFAVKALDLLVNPDGITRYYEEERDATASERNMAQYIGAGNLAATVSIGSLAWIGGNQNSKLANGLMLGAVAVHEVVQQFQTVRQDDKPGFLAFKRFHKNFMTGLRVVVGLLSAVALYKVYDEEDED